MRIRSLVTLLLGAGFFFCCGREKGSNPPARQVPLVILLSSEPTNFDPQIPFDDSEYVLGNIFQTLIRFDSSFRLSPGLALRWTNPDDRTWRFYLDKTARFSDGTPLRAGDVKFSIERLQKLSGSDRQGFTEHIASVETIDESTVDVKTDSAMIILNNLVYIPILNEKNVRNVNQPPFVGTGPYRLKNWVKGSRVVLERNPYAPKPPSIAEVEFILSSKPDLMLNDVQRFKPDVTISLPFRKIEQFQKMKKENRILGLNIQSANGISVFYLVFNLRDSIPDFPAKNPLADIRLRKALAYATNKQELVEKVLWGFGRPAEEVVAPEILGYDPSCATPGYNLEIAKKMVKDAGYEGLKLPIYGNTSASHMMEQVLMKHWAEIGVQGTLRTIADKDLAKGLNEGKFTVAITGYVCQSGDASEILTFNLHSRDPQLKYGKGNYAFYSNPEVDRIAEENLRVFDPKKRLGMLQRSLHIVSDELPYLPLLVLNDVYIVSDRLKWHPGANGEVLCADMSFR